PTRVRAVACLQPDLDRPLGDVVAKPRTSLGAAWALWLDAAHSAAERWLDDDTRPVINSAHHLVAGHEWIAGQRVEVQRCMAADCGEVWAADARQGGHHPHPV